MSGRPEPTDPQSRLARLLKDEELVSARRRRVQDQIDFIHGGGHADPESKDDTLKRLREEERKISAERRELQDEIDELRAEIGLPPSPDRSSKKDTGSA